MKSALEIVKHLAETKAEVKRQLETFQMVTGFSERYFFKVRAKAGLNNPKQQQIGRTRELHRTQLSTKHSCTQKSTTCFNR